MAEINCANKKVKKITKIPKIKIFLISDTITILFENKFRSFFKGNWVVI